MTQYQVLGKSIMTSSNSEIVSNSPYLGDVKRFIYNSPQLYVFTTLYTTQLIQRALKCTEKQRRKEAEKTESKR